MKTRLSVTLLAAIAVTACKGLENVGVRFGSEAATSVANGIKDSSKQLKEGLDSVGTGLAAIKDIDPVALKELLARNQDLEKRLRELQVQLVSYGPRAGIVNVTTNNRVYFEITGYQGTLRLSAWVDDEKNWFIRNAVLQANPAKLAITYDAAYRTVEDIGRRAWTEITGKPMDGHLWTCEGADTQRVGPNAQRLAACRFSNRVESSRKDIDAEYKRRVETAFGEFLKGPFTIPTGALREPQAIDQRFIVKSGEHIVYLRVTPVQPQEEKWALEFKTYVTGPSGAQLLISTGRLDSDTSQWSSGAPLPDAEAARFAIEVSK